MIRMCNCSSTNWKPWLIFLPFWSYFWSLLTFITPFILGCYPLLDLSSVSSWPLTDILLFSDTSWRIQASFILDWHDYLPKYAIYQTHSWLWHLFLAFLARYFLWFILALSLGKFWSLLKIADFSYDGQHLSIYILAMVIQYYKPCLAFEVFYVTSHSYSRAHPHLCRSFVA